MPKSFHISFFNDNYKIQVDFILIILTWMISSSSCFICKHLKQKNIKNTKNFNKQNLLIHFYIMITLIMLLNKLCI